MWSQYVALAALVACAQGYSSGAPQAACNDMIPQHPVPPQKSRAPYKITANAKVVKAGAPVKVVISGDSPSNTIGGLLLQARHGDKPIGQFTIAPEDTFSQLLDCTTGIAVTHKKHKPQDEKQSFAYTWTPPKDFKGEIKFRATAALNGAVFWVGVTSEPLQVV